MSNDTVRGQRIDQHEIIVRRTTRSEDLKSCQIAFVGRTESKNLPSILANLKGSSTLLIGDGHDFAERGGAIQMYLEEKSVRFSINIDVVKRAHLAISSNVLALAKIVYENDTQRVN
jgi:hypothetical protein